jgi:hypothetical protein
MNFIDPDKLTCTQRSMIVVMRAFRGTLPIADFTGKWARAGLVDEWGKLTPAGERLADKVAREDGFNITWQVRTD